MVKEPKVVQQLRAWRVYDIAIGADFSMSLGVLVNKMINASGLPAIAEEESAFIDSYNAPHPAANQPPSVTAKLMTHGSILPAFFNMNEFLGLKDPDVARVSDEGGEVSSSSEKPASTPTDTQVRVLLIDPAS